MGPTAQSRAAGGHGSGLGRVLLHSLLPHSPWLRSVGGTPKLHSPGEEHSPACGRSSGSLGFPSCAMEMIMSPQDNFMHICPLLSVGLTARLVGVSEAEGDRGLVL